MQDGVLGPHHVDAVVGHWYLLEAPVHHVDCQGTLSPGVEVAIARVLDLAQVQAPDLAAVIVDQVTGRPAVPGADVQHASGGLQPFDHGRHPPHRPSAGVEDGVALALVEADVDVLAAPHGGVEAVGIVAVVVVPCRLHRLGVRGSQRHSGGPFLVLVELLRHVDEEVRVFHPVSFLEVGEGLHLLEADLAHELSDVVFAQREHVQVKHRAVRELVAEPGQSLVHVLGLGADVVAAVVVDVLGGEPIVEDVVVVPLIQDQDAVVLEHRVELGESFAAILLREQMGQRVAQADDRVVLGVNVPAQPPPVGVKGLHDEALLLGVLEGLSQHLRTAVHAGDVEPGLQEPNGVEAGPGGHVQHPFDSAFLENVDEKIPFAGGSGIPVDELVPLPDEVVHVLALVLVRLPLGNGVVAI